MRTFLSTKFICGLVVALATTIAATSYSGGVPPAQMGIVTTGGTQVSGGTLNYSFDLSALTSGVLVVKAQIKAKGLKVNIPVFTASPSAGTSTITGPLISIPASFHGTALLRVTAKFNRSNLGDRLIAVTIAPYTAIPSLVSTNLYDVGFENPVTLDGTIVSTVGMTGPITYTWSQTSGMTTALSTNGVPATSFTTGALTNFVTMGTDLYVDYVDGSGNTNQIYVTPAHRFGTDEGIYLENQQATAATYVFRLLVSNGSIARTGTFTVACSVQTPAQPSIPVGVKAFIKGATNSTSWALASAPTGSAATLVHTNGLIPELRPDVEGPYVIHDNVTGTNITLTAASWTGYQFCAVCHGQGNNVGQTDIVTPWSETLHSMIFSNGIDGGSGTAGQSCMQCHTVGYNQSPLATNNNFYAVQQQLGWKFPSVLKVGNFAAMPSHLQGLANIQCENCHGPGSRHPGAPSISLDVKVCANCHQNGTHHVKPEQWEVSPHAGGYEGISSQEGTRSACAGCHSPQGYVDRTRGLTPSVSTGPLTCQVCHDPHNVAQFPEVAHQVRVYDSVTIGDVTKTNGVVNPDGSLSLVTSTMTLTNKGTAALCMSCHNARSLPYQNAGTVGSPIPNYMKSLPHESTATEVLNGIGAADQGNAEGNSFHTYLAECTTCHMYSNGSNTVGDHTFSMTDRLTGDDNVAACNQCHTEPVTGFDFVAVNAQDYDGNGVIEGVQTEVQGLLTILSNKFADVGVTVYDSYPFIDSTSYTTVTNLYPSEAAPIRRALWNRVLIVREGSFGVHNTQFTVRLLQSSYTDLSTNCISLGTGTNGNPFSVDYPNAHLR